MRLLALAVAFTIALAGCITPRPPVRYEPPLRVAVAMVRDDVLHKAAYDVPPEVRAAVVRELEARNLQPVILEPAAWQDDFARVRDSERRLEILGKAEAQADLTVLVETQATFYSQIVGSYRWTVYLKVSVAPRGAAGAPLSRQHDLPAILAHGHEAEPEALAAVAPELARHVAGLLDSYLGDPARAPRAAAAGLENIYFILVDRFDNGDPSNDGAVDRADPAAWHGGDLRGVVRRLDELRDLGVATLWLSPVFQARHAPFMGHGAFHGYWVEDLRRVDPRFGSEADLIELVAQAHRRGMRVLLDYVVNHVGYDAPLLREHPDWFHHAGTIERWDDPEEIVTHEVHGLPDLAQEKPEVRAYLVDAAHAWLDRTGADGLRLDAVKHVAPAFWRDMNGELAARHPGVTLLGELFEGAPELVERVQREGRFTHMFDFPTAFAMRDVFCGGRPAGRLGAVLSSRRFSPDAAHLVTFLDNHDMPRLMTACGGDEGRVENALTAQFAVEGVPALTYGTDAGLEGGPEPQNRGDMVFGKRSPLRAHVAKLLGLRRAHPALARGTTKMLGLDEGVLRFARVAEDEVALVAVNGGDAARPVLVPRELEGATLRDALTGELAGDSPRVEPRATRILVARAQHARELAFPGAGRKREVRFLVTGLEKGTALVGSGPELGNWDAKRGVALGQQGTSLSLPVGVVFAYKLVVRAADGSVKWDPGQDRYLFVGDGPGPMAVEVVR